MHLSCQPNLWRDVRAHGGKSCIVRPMRDLEVSKAAATRGLTGSHSAVLVQLELPQMPTETLLATSCAVKLPTMELRSRAGSACLHAAKRGKGVGGERLRGGRDKGGPA